MEMGFQAAPLGDKQRYFDVDDEMSDVILRMCLEQPAKAASRKRTREEAGPTTRDVFLHAFIVRDSPFFDAIWTRWRTPGRISVEEEEEHGLPQRKKGRASRARPSAEASHSNRPEASLNGAVEEVAVNGRRLGRCVVHASVSQPEDMDAMHHLMRHWCVFPWYHVQPSPAAALHSHINWKMFSSPRIDLDPDSMLASPSLHLLSSRYDTRSEAPLKHDAATLMRMLHLADQFDLPRWAHAIGGS